MKKNLLAVAVAAALWNTVTLANLQPASESATPTSPTVEETSYQRLSSAATSVTVSENFILIEIGGTIYRVYLPG